MSLFYEEELTLPGVNPSNPFTVMEGRQFTIGGFAWRLVIYPNGEDDVTRGLISIRLQCATSKQMARCRTKFYLNDIHTSDVFDNTFPSNEISETSYSAKFDGKAGRRMFDHVIDVLIKVEFMDLTYMVEEHIPLNDPEHYPIYVINEFNGKYFVISD